MNRLVPLAVALMLSGCASSMSGIGGNDKYACKAPEGALCTSVSGVYANSRQASPVAGKTSRSLTPPTAAVTYGATSIAPSTSQQFRGHPGSGQPALRSAPRVLRVWIAPWEDSDGDLHEASMVHVVVDTGRWLIDHVRPAARDRIQGIAPPSQDSAEQATKPGVPAVRFSEALPPAPANGPASLAAPPEIR